MKVILLEDVKNQGKKDDVITVNDGYATNFLIKKKLAVPFTKTSSKILNEKLEDNRKKEEAEIKRCEKIREKLLKENLEFVFKSGKDGKLFGTVTSKQISDELKKLGYDIDKKSIILSEKITKLGVYNITLNLHKKVVANIKVHIC